MIRVYVVAKSEVVRAGLVSLLESNGGGSLSVTGSSASLDQFAGGDVDILLLDGADANDLQGSDLESVSVVLLTDDSPFGTLQDGLQAGVRAVLPRSASANAIAGAITAVANGLVALPLEAWSVAGEARRIQMQPGETPREALTAREAEVLRMLAEGVANKNIAWRLGISEHTVKFHISSIFAKLNVSTRTEAVAVGIRLGLIML